MPGNTRTGGVLEAMVLPALDRGGYRHRAQVQIGDRLGCRKHVVDAVAEKDGREVLISVKWQQVAGTAEQKVPFELICLLDAIDRDRTRTRISCSAVKGGSFDSSTSVAD